MALTTLGRRTTVSRDRAAGIDQLRSFFRRSSSATVTPPMNSIHSITIRTQTLTAPHTIVALHSHDSHRRRDRTIR